MGDPVNWPFLIGYAVLIAVILRFDVGGRLYRWHRRRGQRHRNK